jgi:hypothetical protein
VGAPDGESGNFQSRANTLSLHGCITYGGASHRPPIEEEEEEEGEEGEGEGGGEGGGGGGGGGGEGRCLNCRFYVDHNGTIFMNIGSI